MKKHTLIENIKLDPHTYLVTIGTDMGQFTGAVECKEKDWDRESKYLGFELAEMKAEIEYARAKKKYYVAQLAALNQFWGDMAHTRTYDVDAFWVKKIDSMIGDLYSKRDFWNDRIKYLKKTYHLTITTFDSLRNNRGRQEGHNND